ncbi:MAG: ATP-binding protein [Capsulimonadaceae bacterium]|nr:ATP-binding protein [Capsulimonadaceae bacterium]
MTLIPSRSAPAVPNRDGAKSFWKARPLSAVTVTDSARNGPLILGLLLIITVALRLLEHITAGRPYTIFYLLPVALAAAFVSQSFGYLVSAISVALAAAFLFPNGYSPSYAVEMIGLVFGSATIAIIVGRLRDVLVELDRAKSSLLRSEEQRVTFNREVLMAVTHGRLLLCDAAEIAKLADGVPLLTMPVVEPRDASMLRADLRSLVEAHHLANIRLDDLETAAVEAAANAIKHGRGGTATVWIDGTDVLVFIQDHGDGISPVDLARATLERGYSSLYSLGMGFTMILESVDTMALATSENGTQVLIRVGSGQRPTPEQTLLARYDIFDA